MRRPTASGPETAQGAAQRTAPWSMVVPTDGDSPLLLPLLAAARAALHPPELSAVVWTSESPPPPALSRGARIVLRDTGPPNIHRWWNLGIAACPTDVVLVVNDDVEVRDPSDLSRVAAAASRPGTVLAAPWSPSPVLGWCWALDRSHGILPDESYRWWYGDDDLFARAAPAIARPPAPGLVHRKHRRAEFGALRRICREDALLWESRASARAAR